MNNTKKMETMEFQAEVKKLLDIVINSLYTNKDIFIRELISNSADALERIRHISLLQKDYIEKDLPLEIQIDLNKKLKTITISDTGVGMTKEELIENLGTIAHSGSQEFLKQLERMNQEQRDGAQIIGQFGVGFYSVFMVAKWVKVITRSYKPASKGWMWSSDGHTGYTIEPEEGIKRGTRVVIELKDDAEEYVDEDKVKQIIKEYSNFVPFPIKLEGKKVNTVQAIWTKNKKEIKEHEYNEFYKYIANSASEPRFRLHLNADAPIQLSALLFVPEENIEKYLFSRLDPGVNLYCNKILIAPKCKEILPEYFRFIKGVVDSEDLPLNISREGLQDNRILIKLKKALTKRLISFFQKQSEKDADKYNEFFREFGIFIKEGCSEDFENREELAKLLRFESSKEEPGKLISLSDYVSRMQDKQRDIFYLNGSDRTAIEAGPYLEMFKARDIEVLYCFDPVDDFVLTSLREFDGKKLVSADQEKIDLPPLKKKKKLSEEEEELGRRQVKQLVKWMKEILSDRVADVKASDRLVESPAIIVNPDEFMTTSMQRVMQATQKEMTPMGKMVLEINANHPIIIRLARLKEEKSNEEETLKKYVHQIADNALISAGLLTDTRTMVSRVYEIMESALSS